mgnify:CR=1 FL=1
MIWVFLVSLAAFLVIDAIALKWMMYPLFTRHVGELLRDNPQLGVALGFYVFYVAGIVYFAINPALTEQSLGRAVVNGAILGFLAYGTYESTNMATLRGWDWSMVLTDIAWGTVLTATVAAIGYGTGRLLT